MLENILKLEGVQLLNKAEQSSIKGSRLINCVRNVMEINGSEQLTIDCYDTDAGRYRLFNVLGQEIECPN